MSALTELQDEIVEPRAERALRQLDSEGRIDRSILR